MNRQEKGRLYIVMTKLQGAMESSDNLKERLKDSSEGVEEKLKQEVECLAEKLEEICRDLYELGAPQKPSVHYDLNRIVKEQLIRGWTQQVLANNSKLHKATVSSILKRGRGSPQKIKALAKAVDLELADLIVDE